MSRYIAWLVGVLSLFVLPAGVMGLTSYDVTGLTPLSGDDVSTAYGLNDSGQVIGISVAVDLAAFDPGASSSTSRKVTAGSGYLYNGSSFSAIPTLGTLSSGASLSFPVAINAAGEVVGSSNTSVSGGTAHIAFNYKNGVMTNLGSVFGGATNDAIDVNDSGVIVGDYRQQLDTGPAAVPILYNGTVQSLGTSAYSVSAVVGINNSGSMIGIIKPSGASAAQSAIFSSSGYESLPTLAGASTTYPLAINSAGNVAGWSGTPAPTGGTPVTTINETQANGVAILLGLGGGLAIGEGSEYETGEAFYYDAATQKMTNLGTLGGGFSAALGMNDSGDVVGMSLTAAGNYNAFLYEDSTMVNLNSLLPANSGWTLNEANGINNSGDIVGFGVDDGTYEGFLLTPGGTITGAGGNGGKTSGGSTTGGTSAVPMPPAFWSSLSLLAGLALIAQIKTCLTHAV